MSDNPDSPLPWPGLGPAPNLIDFSEHQFTRGLDSLTATSADELLDAITTRQRMTLETIKSSIASQLAQKARVEELVKLGQVSLSDAALMAEEVDEYVSAANKAMEQMTGAFEQSKKLSVDLLKHIADGAVKQQGGPKPAEIQRAEDEIKAQQARIEELQQQMEASSTRYANFEESFQNLMDDYIEKGDELREARARGEPTEELQTEVDRLFQRVNTKTNLEKFEKDFFTKAKGTFTKGLDKASKAIRVADATLEAAKEYSDGWKVTNFLVKQLGHAIEEYTAPLKKFAVSLKRISKVVKDGYEAYAASLIEGGEAEEFLENVYASLGKDLDKEKDSVKSQLKIIDNIVQSEVEGEELSAAVTAEVSRWMSPSWRLNAALDDDLIAFGESLAGISKFNFLIYIGKGVLALVRTIVRIPLIVAYSGLEAAIGVRSTLAVVETLESILGLVGDIVGVILSPTTQTLLLAFYGFIDAFRVHNFGSWEYDMLWVVTAGLSANIDGAQLLQYDKFSSKGESLKPGKPSKMWSIDHKEFATVLDFWAKEYLREKDKLVKTTTPYRPYENFGGVFRRPGLYIDPKNHPYDADQDLQACIQLENDLDVGLLVDESGHITGADPLGHTTSNLFKRERGLVRNLVAFPLYKNTVSWPPRDGSFVQTKGNFSPTAVDPTIAKLWEKWVTSGEWGIAFLSGNATDQSRADAIRTNLLDYHYWLYPTRDDPLIWTKISRWVSNNNGKKKVLQQKMHGVTLNVLKKEWVTDHPVKHDSSLIGSLIPGVQLSEFQNSIDFVEGVFDQTGRYPVTPKAREFYTKVIQHHVTSAVVQERVGSFDNIVAVQEDRPSTQVEIQKYTRVMEQITAYMDALQKTQDDTDKAWDITLKDSLFEAYVADTSPRTLWGYISHIRVLLVAEIQTISNVMAGTREAQVWAEYLKTISRAGIPLNTNRYGRLAFTGRLNQLVYSKTEQRSNEIEKELEKTGGSLLVNKLITTGLDTGDLSSWANGFRNTAILLSSTDFPVYFGNLHCRIVVFGKPKPTCFVVFRGTTNFWEWVVDLDFSGAEYGRLEQGKPGTYNMKISEQNETASSDLESLVYKDSDAFSVHRGFLRCWQTFRPTVVKELDAIYKQFDIQDVIVTGHSLGAGITQIACMDLPSLPRKKTSTDKTMALGRLAGLVPVPEVEYMRPHAYMYSSPNVGDHRFAWHFENQTGESAHAYIDGDVVTMIPPFLIPAQESWGGATMWGFLKDLEQIAGEDAGAVSTAWALISRIFKGAHLPMDPTSWRTGDSFDWKKISDSGLKLLTAYNKYRAVRGGGVFLRLHRDQTGTFDETAYDSGNTTGSMEIISKSVVDVKDIAGRHSIDNVVSTIDKVVQANPDIFKEIDQNEHPDWGDAGSTPNKPQPVNPSLPPNAKIVGIARSTKQYYPGQVVSKEHIDRRSIVLFPDVDELKRKNVRQINRRKKRKTMEGEYHGY